MKNFFYNVSCGLLLIVAMTFTSCDNTDDALPASTSAKNAAGINKNIVGVPVNGTAPVINAVGVNFP